MVFVTFGLGKVERKKAGESKTFFPANLALFSSLAKKTFCDRDFFTECKIQNSPEIDWRNFLGGGNKRDYFLGFTPNFSTDAEEIRAKVASFPFSAFLSPPHIQRERESQKPLLFVIAAVRSVYLFFEGSKKGEGGDLGSGKKGD